MKTVPASVATPPQSGKSTVLSGGNHRDEFHVGLRRVVEWLSRSVRHCSAAAGLGLVMLSGSVYGQSAASSQASPGPPESGLARLILDIYQHDLVLYGLTVVVVMVVMGVTIGYALDFLIKKTGIDLGKLEHFE